MKHSLLLKITALLALFVAIPSSLAHSPSHDSAHEESLKSLVSQSALIIQGQVIDIQYRNSKPTEEQPQGVPHTFVTYRVMNVLRGKVSEEKITLRIPGGADGQGGIYMTTDAPTFSRNQTDVLFIKGGEDLDCPLVDCVEGRFRIHENQVYNAWGIPVVDAREQLVVGGRPRFDLNVMDVPQPSFESLIQRPDIRREFEQKGLLKESNLKDLKARYEREAPKFVTVSYGVQSQPIRGDVSNEPEAEIIQKYARPLTTQSFLESVREWNSRVGPSNGFFVNANPDESFFIPDPKVEKFADIQSSSTEVTEEERNDKSIQEEQQ